jgi:hypothetical protein
MIMKRIGDIDRVLYTLDYSLVEFYESLSVEDLLIKKEKLIKEQDIYKNLKKNIKPVNDIIDIVDLVIEKKTLLEMYKVDGDVTKGVTIG